MANAGNLDIQMLLPNNSQCGTEGVGKCCRRSLKTQKLLRVACQQVRDLEGDKDHHGCH